jgi:tRNA dimethylallyltransferase
MSRKITVITGPTAVGKTDKAISLAKELSCPILSADSRQVYRELNIGVARPDEEQLAAAQHYLIAHVSIHEPYNAGRYAEEGRHLINELFEIHENLIICGGTGLYINALLNGLDPLPGRNEPLRAELETLLKEHGIEALQKELETLNPGRHGSIDLQNPQRLIRAIEIESSPAHEQSPLPCFRYSFETEIINMDCGREELYERINRRVDRMIETGLEQEVRNLSEFRHLNALQSVGYSEWWPYFDGQAGIDEVTDKIKQHSRNYAKRQMTWFRNKQ